MNFVTVASEALSFILSFLASGITIAKIALISALFLLAPSAVIGGLCGVYFAWRSKRDDAAKAELERQEARQRELKRLQERKIQDVRLRLEEVERRCKRPGGVGRGWRLGVEEDAFVQEEEEERQ